MAASIEAGGSMLKISYLRFISDAAPGLVVIFVAIILHDRGVFSVFQCGMGKEAKALLAVVAILLAVPVGLVVNGASHLVLGPIQTRVNQLCFRVRSWPIHDTHRSSLTDAWSRCFSVKRERWPLVAETVDELLLVYAPDVAEALDHVRALKKFLRSTAFLALVGFLIRLVIEIPRLPHAALSVPDWVAWTLLATSCLAITLGGFITFYQQVSGMMRAFLLCGMPQEQVTISIPELRQILIDRGGNGSVGSGRALEALMLKK